MLLLKRAKDESIIVNTSDGIIEITILQTSRNGKVCLGITATKNIPVHRKEIHLAIEREKAEAEQAERNRYGTKSNLSGKAH